MSSNIGCAAPSLLVVNKSASTLVIVDADSLLTTAAKDQSARRPTSTT